jgi:hypothetical protein
MRSRARHWRSPAVTAHELAEAELRSLLAEIDTARDLLGRLASELKETDPGDQASPSREVLALLAMDLHSWYTALEALMVRVLTVFEGGIPAGEASHALVLRAALRGIEGVRPAVLSAGLRESLDEIRRFRHFFRHAYALDLRYDRLRCALRPLLECHQPIDQDLARFAQIVRELAEQIRQQR